MGLGPIKNRSETDSRETGKQRCFAASGVEHAQPNQRASLFPDKLTGHRSRDHLTWEQKWSRLVKWEEV
jgi:hypothetical protein